MTATTLPGRMVRQTDTTWLTRKLVAGVTPARILLVGIILLSAALHLVNIGAIGDANMYYTAAVKSMLQSWSNFFFVAAEPGGSVTVDKPPLGLWVEAAFAWLLGVSGVTVSLPNVIAGILSVPLLYILVKKHLGTGPGLIAALVLAVTPVAVAADRNNTMDGMLTFTLLLAAWAFIRATETGRLPPLLLGALLVGLGFNIKMMQAFLPLPAFYALYFLGARNGWGRKVLYLGAATLVVLAVSLSWALVVDSVPADQRPYIGSSSDNTVMELIVGHNGLNRLFGGRRAANNEPANPVGQPPYPPNGQLPPSQPGLPGAQGGVVGQPPYPPNGQPPADGSAAQRPPGGTFNETGEAGLLRFFRPPLAKEMSWLLPLGLLGIVAAVLAHRLRLPLSSDAHKAVVLWGGWLLTCLVFFSVAGFFHAYYMIMLAPALGAAVALGAAAWREVAARQRRLALVLLLVAAGVTLDFQLYLALTIGGFAWWMLLAGAALLVGGTLVVLSVLVPPEQATWQPVATAIVLAAVLIIPLTWTVLTIADDSPNVNLPSAYAGDPLVGATPASGKQNHGNQALLRYLEANTSDTTYLMAVPNAFSGAPYILATGRPVLYMGGFSGSDPVVNARDVAQMVDDGELRYILLNGERQGRNRGIANWLSSACTIVPEFSQPMPNRAGHPQATPTLLYMCGEPTG